MTTFTFNKIKPESIENFEPQEFSEVVKRRQFFDKKFDTIAVTSKISNSVQSKFGHGLIGTMFAAYSLHISLVLRPDDFWTAICFSFSSYVENAKFQFIDKLEFFL